MPSPPPSPLPALLNPLGGSAAAARRALLADPRFALQEVPPGRIADTVRAAAHRGVARVLVCGGDGTVAAALGAATGTALEIAVLPGGTLNHFARDMGIPTGAAAALDVAASGVAVPVDLGDVNGHPVLNTCAVGAYTDFVRARDARERWLGYGVASVVAALQAWWRLRTVVVEIRADDGAHLRVRTPLLFVGVGERILDGRGLGARRAGGARALHLIAIRERSRRRTLALAIGAATRGLDAFLGRAADAHLVTEAEAAMGGPTGTLAIDGELVAATSPLRFRLRRDAAMVVRS